MFIVVTPLTIIAATLAGLLIAYALPNTARRSASMVAVNLFAAGLIFVCLVMGARFLDGSLTWYGWFGQLVLWAVTSTTVYGVLRRRA